MPLSENPEPIEAEDIKLFADWLAKNKDRFPDAVNGIHVTNGSSTVYAGIITENDRWNALLHGKKLSVWSKKGSSLVYDTETGAFNHTGDMDGDTFLDVVETFKKRARAQ